MKIIMILTNGFDPDPRVYKEAKALIEVGHQVEVLAWDREHIYDKSIEEKDGIIIKRFYQRAKYGSGIKQVIPYIKFAKEVKRYLKNTSYDMVHCHDLDGGLIGIYGAKKPRVWDIHEYYDGRNKHKIIRLFLGFLGKFCFKWMDGIIFVIEMQYEKYKSAIRKKCKTVIVKNTTEIQLPVWKIKENKAITIAYIGVVRQYMQLKMLLDAVKDKPGIALQINGGGIAYEQLFDEAIHIDNVHVTGRFTYKELPKFYEKADLIYAVYDASLENANKTIPVKAFEAFAAKIPIIAAKNTYLGDFVYEMGIGFVVDSNNPIEIEQLVDELLQNKALILKAHKQYEKMDNNYRWENDKRKLIELYEYLL